MENITPRKEKIKGDSIGGGIIRRSFLEEREGSGNQEIQTRKIPYSWFEISMIG